MQKKGHYAFLNKTFRKFCYATCSVNVMRGIAFHFLIMQIV